MPKFPPGASSKGSRAAAAAHTRLARKFYAALRPILLELRGKGMSIRAIAAELERRQIRTRHGFARWHANSVHRAILQAVTPAEIPPPQTEARS